jgi:hypothetical protein
VEGRFFAALPARDSAASSSRDIEISLNVYQGFEGEPGFFVPAFALGRPPFDGLNCSTSERNKKVCLSITTAFSLPRSIRFCIACIVTPRIRAAVLCETKSSGLNLMFRNN